VLRSEEFLAGATDTAFLGRHPEVFAPLVADRAPAALAAALAGAADRRARASWGALPAGWRNVATGPRTTAFEGGLEVEYRGDEALIATPDLVVLERDGIQHRYRIARAEGRTYVDSADGSVTLVDVPRFSVPRPERPAGSLLAPMPATVGRVAVEVGQRVEAGAVLLTLEAMKLEHPILAPEPGVVAELDVRPGHQVEAGALLAVITPDSANDPEESA